MYEFCKPFIPYAAIVIYAICILFIIGWCRMNSRIRKQNISFMPSKKKENEEEYIEECEESEEEKEGWE